MSLGSWIGNSTAAAADIKRQAHAVRCAIDALPVYVHPETGRRMNPRHARRIACPSRVWGTADPVPLINPGIR